MSNTKFTKGPWKTDFCEVQHCWSLTSEDTEITMAWASEAPTREDGHLIASAPDLYEQLQEALEILEGIFQSHNVINASMYLEEDDLISIKSALSKARGE